MRQVKTPARAAVLCGGLVGGCSALLAATAHSAGGSALPGGSAVLILMIACVTVGATTTARLSRARKAGPFALAAGLVVGQAVGHVALVAGGPHHGSHGFLPSASMLAAHAAAAVALGLLISLVGHLYEVCATALSWLSLVPVHRGRQLALPWGSYPNVMHSRLLRSGRRMRAPPHLVR